MSPGTARLLAAALSALALVSTIAALVITFQSADRMLPIVLHYATALTAAIGGVRLGQSAGRRSNGLKMLAMLAVLALLTTMLVWTVLDTWSTIGKCERREDSLFHTRYVWHEGTACTEEEREGYTQNL